eukprot:TRINITY_DN1716_c0_g1_i3.p2 TRINITY_DN1716_c0_g1~~TRINITY_DN1716_c0_g1_i3.p2  ORF type:complete len:197 (+),score=-26.27 TRINITY_DN1716_c0_g1_i3:183-773(+)
MVELSILTTQQPQNRILYNYYHNQRINDNYSFPLNMTYHHIVSFYKYHSYPLIITLSAINYNSLPHTHTDIIVAYDYLSSQYQQQYLLLPNHIPIPIITILIYTNDNICFYQIIPQYLQLRYYCSLIIIFASAKSYPNIYNYDIIVAQQQYLLLLNHIITILTQQVVQCQILLQINGNTCFNQISLTTLLLYHIIM